jgi:hypothetical protein
MAGKPRDPLQRLLGRRASLVMRLAHHERLVADFSRFEDSGGKWFRGRSEAAARKRREEIAEVDAQLEVLLMGNSMSGPPPPGWRLIAGVSFTAGDRHYARGSEVDPAVLATWRNGRALLESNVVRWMPPYTSPVARPAPPVIPPQPSEPVVSHVERYATEMRRIMTEKGCPWSIAEDLIDADLVMRAQREFAIERSGGTSRRDVSGFKQHCQGLAP